MVIKIINAMFAGAMQMMAFYDAIFSQNVIADFIKYSTLIVRILLPFVFLFQVYKQVVVNQDSSYLDVLFRLVVVMILLSVYPAFYIQTVNTVDEISYNLIMETGVKERLENEGIGLDAIGSGDEEEGEENNEGGFFSQVGDVMSKALAMTNSLTDLNLPRILVQVSTFLSVAVVIIILLIRNILLILVTFIAPFAIPFFITSSLDEIFTGWLEFFITLLLIPIFMSFILYIQTIMVSTVAQMDLTNTQNLATSIFVFAYNIAYIFLLILSPSLIAIIKGGGTRLFAMLQIKLLNIV